MKYLIDTNVCIKFLNGRSEKLKQKFISTDFAEICLCTIVKAELYYGAEKSQNSKTNFDNVKYFDSFKTYSFDDQSAQIYGKIRTQLEKSGVIIGPNDLLIASIAIANNLILVTNNLKEFARIKELKLEDWEV